MGSVDMSAQKIANFSRRRRASGEAPGQQRARRQIASHVERGVREQGAPARRLHVLPHHETPREGDEQPDQEEQQPPAAGSERIEPQRGEQGEDRGLREPPADLPPVERPCEVALVERSVPAVSDRRREGEEQGHRQPGAEQPPERHRRRRSGGTYPGPRSPRPGRAAVSVPRSATLLGSKTVMSAAMSGASRPRSRSPTRSAASEVILRTANSSGNSLS